MSRTYSDVIADLGRCRDAIQKHTTIMYLVLIVGIALAVFIHWTIGLIAVVAYIVLMWRRATFFHRKAELKQEQAAFYSSSQVGTE